MASIGDSAGTLDRLAARAGQLFSLPAVAMRVLDLTENPQVDTRALKECIENDPALTSRILRVVNSSLFGLSREVSDLNQALALMGTKPLKLLVLGFSLPSGMFLGIEAKTLAWYWRRTLTKAVAARELAERIWKMPGDEVFIAGLLQDLGTLLLLQQLGESYAQFLDRAVANGVNLIRAEMTALGFTHTMLTARLLTQWRLPEALVAAVAAQPAELSMESNAAIGEAPDGHEQSGDDLASVRLTSPLEQILRMAELIARVVVDKEPGALRFLLAMGKAAHGTTMSQLENLIEDLEEKVEQLAGVLSLQLPDGLEYRDVLADAHRQLAQVAGQAAEELLQRGTPALPDGLDEKWIYDDLQDLTQAVAKIWKRNDAAEPGKETVAAPSASQLTTATAAATREVAMRQPEGRLDPIDDPLLLKRLALAAAACRQSRRPLSLLLAELVSHAPVATADDARRFATLRRVLEDVVREVDHPCAMSSPHGGGTMALILPDCERREAVACGDQLIRRFQQKAAGNMVEIDPPVSVAAGVATVTLPPKNFPVADLLAGANRCLFGSRSSGGGVVRSIEIY